MTPYAGGNATAVVKFRPETASCWFWSLFDDRANVASNLPASVFLKLEPIKCRCAGAGRRADTVLAGRPLTEISVAPYPASFLYQWSAESVKQYTMTRSHFSLAELLPRSLHLTPTRLSVLVSAFLVINANSTFYQKLVEVYPVQDGNLIFIVSLALFHFGFLLALCALFSLLIPTRIVVSLLILLAAAVGYFTDRLQVIVDSEMVRNIFETDYREASDLFNWGLLKYFFLWGLVPVAVIWSWPLRKAGTLRELRFKLQAIVVAMTVMMLCVVTQGDFYASFFRVHKPLRSYMNPSNTVYSIGVYVNREFFDSAPQSFSKLAGKSAVLETDVHRELVVLVVGETARADHFSLNGYQRETNPELAARERVISYSQISSCGTSTSVSVPCMFSHQGRDNFDQKTSSHTENILDLLARTGVNILWRDNSTGSKGVAGRVKYESYAAPDVNPICDPECRDVGMLSGLQEYIDAQPGDVLIVLHQMGSHGPAYFKRYPPAFERFLPACKSMEMSECTTEEIVNAYDNSILYTDYFLAQVIDFLQANTPAYETSMLYISDHGESLGENGLFLHGVPYLFAPIEQTHVPVIIWSGEASDIDYEASLELRNAPNSHDALFETLLALFEVETDLTAVGNSHLVYLKEDE